MVVKERTSRMLAATVVPGAPRATMLRSLCLRSCRGFGDQMQAGIIKPHKESTIVDVVERVGKVRASR